MRTGTRIPLCLYSLTMIGGVPKGSSLAELDNGSTQLNDCHAEVRSVGTDKEVGHANLVHEHQDSS